MNATRVGRLLIDLDGDAAWNMAVDQAIAESTSERAGTGQPTAATLRFYTWAEPTLSLGYFQSSEDSSPRFDGIERVRRSTGGGAILHHHELTYSLTVPTKPGEHGARSDLYRAVHAAFVTAMDGWGVTIKPHSVDKRPQNQADPFLCFQRRTDEDLILSGYKVLGSAQRRVKHAVMQHGSLLLRASSHASELPGIADLTSIVIDIAQFTADLAAVLGNALNISFETGPLTTDEGARASLVVVQRFANKTWWTRR